MRFPVYLVKAENYSNILFPDIFDIVVGQKMDIKHFFWKQVKVHMKYYISVAKYKVGPYNHCLYKGMLYNRLGIRLQPAIDNKTQACILK